MFSHDAKGGGTRPGSASRFHGCDTVGPVPDELRDSSFYRPVDAFYQKYTHAYGIPILGMILKYITFLI